MTVLSYQNMSHRRRQKAKEQRKYRQTDNNTSYTVHIIVKHPIHLLYTLQLQ